MADADAAPAAPVDTRKTYDRSNINAARAAAGMFGTGGTPEQKRLRKLVTEFIETYLVPIDTYLTSNKLNRLVGVGIEKTKLIEDRLLSGTVGTALNAIFAKQFDGGASSFNDVAKLSILDCMYGDLITKICNNPDITYVYIDKVSLKGNGMGGPSVITSECFFNFLANLNILTKAEIAPAKAVIKSDKDCEQLSALYAIQNPPVAQAGGRRRNRSTRGRRNRSRSTRRH